MRLSLKWVNEFLSEALSKEEAEDAFLSVGIEVDTVVDASEGLENVVLAQVVDFEKHPDADRLRLCEVSDGQESFQIVCGASNFEKGSLVALAKVGAKLPNGLSIKKSKIRGIESFGMLCSEEELKLSDSSEGILVLPEKQNKLGTPIAEVLGLDDFIFVLELTPNRGDCLSILGLARELAAAKGIAVKAAEVADSSGVAGNRLFEVEQANLAPRYALTKIEEINMSAGMPRYISNRLLLCGMRPLNPLVDLTNYVMLERGQPTHAFDAQKVKGQVRVRFAKRNEQILCLDGETRVLEEADLVIADDDGPIALAGIIGGQRTAVSSETKMALLESAFFDPSVVRKTAKRLKVSTESSYRFERHTDIQSTSRALNVLAQLCTKFLSARISEKESFVQQIFKPEKILLSAQNLQRVLGKTIPEAGDYLSRLGFSVQKLDEGWSVESLSRRPDIFREIDLIEEVARIHGFNEFESKLPPTESMAVSDAENDYRRFKILKQQLSAKGFLEVFNYSFDEQESAIKFAEDAKKIVALENPINKEFQVMKSSLIPGLLRNISFNMSRQSKYLRIFELGRTFSIGTKKDPYTEERKIALAWAGKLGEAHWDQEERDVDFFDLKGVLESLCPAEALAKLRFIPFEMGTVLNPVKAAKVMYEKTELGYVGELHPLCAKYYGIKKTTQVCELNVDFLRLTEMDEKRGFMQISSFPQVERDFSFLLHQDVSAQAVFDCIEKLKINILSDLEIFDRFEGKDIPKNHYSLSFKAKFGSEKKTLVDKEIEKASMRIVAALEKDLQASQR